MRSRRMRRNSPMVVSTRSTVRRRRPPNVVLPDPGNSGPGSQLIGRRTSEPCPTPGRAERTAEHMRAAVVREFGGPEVLRIVDVPMPAPGPGEVLVKVAGASVNFADVMVREGLNVQYGATAAREQFGLGADVAGTVAALGEGVTRFATGDPVVGTQERLDRPLG